MHADIHIQDQTIVINNSDQLHGHTVKATDLRQGAALVIAGLLCKGYTTVTNISYIQRGYEDIVKDLAGVGAQVKYI